MPKTTDALKIIDNMIGDDSQLQQMCQQATINAHVAQLIYDARIQSGLSQAELANKIGTSQSVISRLEDADYEGNSLSMLNRIAFALNREVKIDLVEFK
ncbi:helix-turn-helix domain-containing protein [Crocosphaera sp.]|uniref:helix-turn-helix domain-containing protein n=1 Tax=Crocosphaera sp. TaxID=2729996 RepID=UPI002612B267|nr:helix-turn-helix domain-containing protein [Crocosphaera sp.]MDJ0578621.1 helix-turn-helix domain-containing protein [Crocosphaera sp.]